MNNEFGAAPDDDGSINMVTVGLTQGPMFFPGMFPQFDDKERILVLLTENMDDGQITFNFDHIVFFRTSRVTRDEILAALAEPDTES